jgi:hypothetical protein
MFKCDVCGGVGQHEASCGLARSGICEPCREFARTGVWTDHEHNPVKWGASVSMTEETSSERTMCERMVAAGGWVAPSVELHTPLPDGAAVNAGCWIDLPVVTVKRGGIRCDELPDMLATDARGKRKIRRAARWERRRRRWVTRFERLLRLPNLDEWHDDE